MKNIINIFTIIIAISNVVLIAIFLFLIINKIISSKDIVLKPNVRKPLKIKYCTTAPDLYFDLNENFAYDYAACFDLLANEDVTIEPRKIGSVDTGLIFCLPFDYELQARPKSGRSKEGCHVELGTIDGDYRGVVFATIYNFTDEQIVIKRGEKICQGRIDKLSFIPRNGDKFIKVKSIYEFDPELRNTSRGDKGFGSSGV